MPTEPRLCLVTFWVQNGYESTYIQKPIVCSGPDHTNQAQIWAEGLLLKYWGKNNTRMEYINGIAVAWEKNGHRNVSVAKVDYWRTCAIDGANGKEYEISLSIKENK